MLPYKNRLINRGDFERVYRYGNFFSFGNITLKVGKNKLNLTRIGFSVGIKFSKKAVERNRIKRQLREIVHKNLNKIKDGFDLVVMIKKIENNTISSDLLELDLLEILKKSNLIIN
jgi:ribonuclease P protein component